MLPSHSITVRNRCRVTAIAPVYRELLAAVITAYVDIWPNRLVDVRLMGSIARGEAISGVSDLDVMGLLNGPPTTTELQQLETVADVLGRHHRQVTRVELDALPIEDMPPFRRFVLSSDSVSISGDDRLTLPSQTMDRIDLAHLVTPDAAAMIEGYSQAMAVLEDHPDVETVRFWSRIVGKDLLKCLRFLILMRGGDYEVGIPHIARQASVYTPEFASLADVLFTLYSQPTIDIRQLRSTLNAADTLLVPALAQPS